MFPTGSEMDTLEASYFTTMAIVIWAQFGTLFGTQNSTNEKSLTGSHVGWLSTYWGKIQLIGGIVL